MKKPRLRTVVLTPLVLFALIYVALAVSLALKDDTIAVFEEPVARYETIVIFGASGTAGDGILKAALANPEIDKIHVISRRATPRIDAGIASGKIQLKIHMDYLNYSEVREQIAEADAIYWAIGISSLGTDEQTYAEIHVDFPARFMAEWLKVIDKPDASFHFISSSDISEDSSAMWVQQKMRAERTLFNLAEGTAVRVIAYRPDYIGPTAEEAHIGQELLYWFFAPVGAAVRAEQIGQAMFEVTARGAVFKNGKKIGTRSIIGYSNAYDQRPKIAG